MPNEENAHFSELYNELYKQELSKNCSCFV